MIKNLKDRKYKISVNDGKKLFSLDDIDLKFSVKKNGSITPNELDLTIYNLSKTHRDIFIKEKNIITLEAGYKDDFGIIFKGTVQKGSENYLNAPNWETKIVSKDGIKELNKIITSKSFAPKSSFESVIKYIIKECGLTEGNLKGIPKEKFGTGYSLSGTAMSQLKTLLGKKKLDFFITDGVLHIIEKNTSINSTAILLDETSGHIDTPKRTNTGWTVKSLLRPNLGPNTLLKVVSKTFTGFLTAKDVSISGYTRGSEWDLTIECIERK